MPGNAEHEGADGQLDDGGVDGVQNTAKEVVPFADLILGLSKTARDIEFSEIRMSHM